MVDFGKVSLGRRTRHATAGTIPSSRLNEPEAFPPELGLSLQMASSTMKSPTTAGSVDQKGSSASSSSSVVRKAGQAQVFSKLLRRQRSTPNLSLEPPPALVLEPLTVPVPPPALSASSSASSPRTLSSSPSARLSSATPSSRGLTRRRPATAGTEAPVRPLLAGAFPRRPQTARSASFSPEEWRTGRVRSPALSEELPPRLVPSPARPPGSPPATEQDFQQYRMPTTDELRRAKACMVRDARGTYHVFGDLVERNGPTVVVFIRHFWCGLCATYVRHLSSFFGPDPESPTRRRLDRANVKVLIIGNGSHELIAKYRNLTACPFDVLTDPTPGNDLYRAVGMTLRTFDAGPSKDRGEYLQRSSFVKSLASSIAHSLRLAKGHPGDMKLLGGEVIFAPTRRTDAASTGSQRRPQTGRGRLDEEAEEEAGLVEVAGIHRMKTTRDHGSVANLLVAVGVDLRTSASCLDET